MYVYEAIKAPFEVIVLHPGPNYKLLEYIRKPFSDS